MNEEEEEDEEEAVSGGGRSRSRLVNVITGTGTGTGRLSEAEILKYAQISPRKQRQQVIKSISNDNKRSKSRMIIVESNPPRRQRRKQNQSVLEYYIQEDDDDDIDNNYNSNSEEYYLEDGDDEEDVRSVYSDDWIGSRGTRRAGGRYKTFEPRPPTEMSRSLSRNRIYNPSTMMKNRRKRDGGNLLTEPQRRYRNQAAAQNVMMRNPVPNKNNHRREMERVEYRDPPTSNKPVIRGGAVIYR